MTTDNGLLYGKYFALPAEELYDLNDPAVLKWWKDMTAEREARATDARDISVAAKLSEAGTPGAVVPFDPDEAERAGAFVEDAMSPEDAAEAEEGLYGEDDYRWPSKPANDDQREP